MSLKRMLLAATVLALPIAAQAQPVSGFYIGAGAGVNLRQGTVDRAPGLSNAQMSVFGSGREVKFGTEPGFAGVGSVGWGFGNGFRAEVEGNYRRNDDSRLGFLGRQAFNSHGRVHQAGVMMNGFYDFTSMTGRLPVRGITPYVGVGAGYVWTGYENVGGTANLGNGSRGSFAAGGVDGRFAYQGIAGLSYDLGAVTPGLALTGEYRFMGTLPPNVRSHSFIQAPTGNILARDAHRPDNYNHSLLVGLRYAFNSAPTPVAAAVVAPMPMAPAQAPARTYLVFFDFDRADLTDRARTIIGDAANAARSVQSTRIEVSGHADRSGAAPYNQRLSLRRAEAVASELVRRGVNRSEIGIQSFGEGRPLVQTADGAREPQNRRVEIVVR